MDERQMARQLSSVWPRLAVLHQWGLKTAQDKVNTYVQTMRYWVETAHSIPDAARVLMALPYSDGLERLAYSTGDWLRRPLRPASLQEAGRVIREAGELYVAEMPRWRFVIDPIVDAGWHPVLVYICPLGAPPPKEVEMPPPLPGWKLHAEVIMGNKRVFVAFVDSLRVVPEGWRVMDLSEAQVYVRL